MTIALGPYVEEAHLNCSPHGQEVKEKGEQGPTIHLWACPRLPEAPPLKDFHYLLIAPQREDQVLATLGP